MSRSIRIPATIILTFPAQVKITPEVEAAAEFACEQHLNKIGIIEYTGPMLPTGTISFGLRVHMNETLEVKGEVIEMFPQKAKKENEPETE